LRFAIKEDLGFEDRDGRYSADAILATLTLVVYPRSMAGLNLNPNDQEKGFQLNNIDLLLNRLCKQTYFMKSGWQIIRQIVSQDDKRPKESTCIFYKGNKAFLENFP
jgi:hypothetical protein